MIQASYLDGIAVFVGFFTLALLITVGLPLLASRLWRSYERNIMIGATVVLCNAVVFGGFVTYVLFGEHFGSVDVRNGSATALSVQFNSDSAGSAPVVVPPGGEQTMLDANLGDLSVTTDTDPPRQFRFVFQQPIWARDLTVEIASGERTATPAEDAVP